MNLQSEFIPYEEAKELKHLGFNEKGLYSYASETIGLLKEGEIFANPPTDSRFISAPTWRQAFKFFREKYTLDSFVSFATIDDSTTAYVWNIVKYLPDGKDRAKDTWDFYDRIDSFQNMDWYDSNEEAELSCLKKLIKLAKQ
mgnify:CR=1 FL=1